jgi:hypothetical protein
LRGGHDVDDCDATPTSLRGGHGKRKVLRHDKRKTSSDEDADLRGGHGKRKVLSDKRKMSSDEDDRTRQKKGVETRQKKDVL